MSNNSNLHRARKAKNDEFYTPLSAIEEELKHYDPSIFKGKIVYCNCDDPQESNFFKYFSLLFEHYGLKKLITTSYNKDGAGKLYIYEGDKNNNRVPDREEIETIPLSGNGDFRSKECIEYLKKADIVVTNPPFSLWREYISQLVEYNKKFLIIGSLNAIKYIETFDLIRENKIWLGVTNPKQFHSLSGSIKKLGNICWFTNLEHNRRREELKLFRRYYDDPSAYPKYDNYDAIEVSRVKDIPVDYFGVMGVPITFLGHHNPKQFKIIDANNIRLSDKVPIKKHGLIKDQHSSVNGKPRYVRVVIQRLKEKE